MPSYLDFFKRIPALKKQNLIFIFITYFFALFSYPLMRSATGAYFYEFYSAQEYPLATFFSIVFLVGAIYLCNRLQKLVGVQFLYLGIAIVTTVLSIISYFAINSGVSFFAFFLFAIKESYIVLLIHLCLAYANNYFDLEEVKKLFGPIGAIGSVGGILGGQFTALFVKAIGTDIVFFISLILIFIAGISFYKTHKIKEIEANKNTLKAPLKSLKHIKKFIFLICTIVALSQWVIFIADLQFNIIFEKIVTSKDSRTEFLGNMYSYINMISLFIQFFIIPYLLSRVSNKAVFLSIPIVYCILSLAILGVGASSLIISSGVFIFLKASDYSVFSYSKEVLYHGLSSAQKYGAKYITDMFVYRLAKAFIAIIMSILSIKNIQYLNIFQIIFIIIWIICVLSLIKLKKEE